MLCRIFLRLLTCQSTCVFTQTHDHPVYGTENIFTRHKWINLKHLQPPVCAAILFYPAEPRLRKPGRISDRNRTALKTREVFPISCHIWHVCICQISFHMNSWRSFITHILLSTCAMATPLVSSCLLAHDGTWNVCSWNTDRDRHEESTQKQHGLCGSGSKTPFRTIHT